MNANEDANEDEDPGRQRSREGRVFVFLAVVLAPVVAAAIVGVYGLSIWIYQVFAGPPTS